MTGMKIAVYDPLKAFTPFLEHCGKTHEVTWIDIPVNADELRWQHIRNDLVWYEFTDERFYQMMRGPKECLIVNRLHSYELFTDVPGKVDWSKVDILCASSDEVKDMLEKKRLQIDFPPIRTLANGPDLDKLQLYPGEYGRKIAVVGSINYKKNLPLALYCLDAVRHLGYEMHFIGGSQDLRFDFYMKHLIESLGMEDIVFFHGHLEQDKVFDLLGNMDYILTTSLFESFGQGIMEGIGCGCLPLIHNFPGAKERFSALGDVFFDTPQQFKELICGYESLDNNQKIALAAAGRAAIEKYQLAEQIKMLDAIFLELGELANG